MRIAVFVVGRQCQNNGVTAKCREMIPLWLVLNNISRSAVLWEPDWYCVGSQPPVLSQPAPGKLKNYCIKLSFLLIMSQLRDPHLWPSKYNFSQSSCKPENISENSRNYILLRPKLKFWHDDALLWTTFTSQLRVWYINIPAHGPGPVRSSRVL